jgi:hypothetical protein
MSEPMGVRSAAHKAMLCEAANGLDQRTLALWATDCAERVLVYFSEHPKDGRPRHAIATARE